VGSNLTPAEAFFWCSLLPALSYLTATCEAILSVKEWNREMKIKQRKRKVVIKNLRSVHMVTRKQSQFILNWGPCPPLCYATAEYCLYTFIFLGSEGDTAPCPTPLLTLVLYIHLFCDFWAEFMYFGSTLIYQDKEFLNLRPLRIRTKYNPFPPSSKFNPHPPHTRKCGYPQPSRVNPSRAGL